MRADVVVVGAGVVGLAHALEAHERGRSVIVVERDARAVGASVRNFGHGCVTAQAGPALEYAMRARLRWTQLGAKAGFAVRETGAVVAARSSDELAVLEEFAQLRHDDVELLDAATVRDAAPLGDDVIGGAWLPLDVYIDSRAAVAAIAAYLADQGVRFWWNTSVGGVEPGAVHTSRGTIGASRTVVCVGHNVDRFFPDIAATRGVQRCALRMLQVEDPHGRAIGPAVLTGLSLLRYSGFSECPSVQAVRRRFETEMPYAVEAGLNLMFTQRPDGSLTVGDTHDYDRTLSPFTVEARDELVLTEAARLLGVPRLTVLERWRGVYASAPDPFLVATPAPGVRAVSVTCGVGMTTAFGLAPTVLDDLL